MDETIPHPQEAAEMLARATELAQSTAKAERTGRRRIYLMWAVILPLAMMWFDIVGEAAAALIVAAFAVVGAVVTALIGRNTVVFDESMMKSYYIIMGAFAFYWAVLVSLIGPALGEALPVGWTLTGLLGAPPFIIGYIWDRKQ